MPWSLGTAFVTEHRSRFLNAAPAKMVGLAGNLVDTVFQLGQVSSAGRLWLPLTGTLRDTPCRVFHLKYGGMDIYDRLPREKNKRKINKYLPHTYIKPLSISPLSSPEYVYPPASKSLPSC